MSEFKLSNTLSIPIEDAKQMIDKYFKNLPKLNEFLKSASAYGKKNLMIRTCKPYRRIRFFDDPKGDNKLIGEIERASKNTVIQGSGADMCKLALVNIRKYIKQNNLQDKVKVVMTVHDQIDCEVTADYAKEWSLIQKKLMEDAGSVIIQGIPVLSEITISDCWTK
jgi:DNA polymerase-1